MSRAVEKAAAALRRSTQQQIERVGTGRHRGIVETVSPLSLAVDDLGVTLDDEAVTIDAGTARDIVAAGGLKAGDVLVLNEVGDDDWIAVGILTKSDTPIDPGGPPGPKGDKGDVGPAGPKGDQGIQGPKGDVGPQGTTGPKGDKGDTGETGAQGAKGDTGATGAKGDQGDPGPQGVQGIQGEVGPKGDTGDTGPKGDTGDEGPQGIQGVKGDTGDQGVQGEPGPKGDQGIQGVKGDTGDVGPKGDQGDEGPIGPKGDKGDKGDTGGAFSEVIGDGVTTSWTLTHGLGTRAVLIGARSTTPPYPRVGAEMYAKPMTPNTVVVEFGSPPPLDSIEVVVMSGAGPEGPQGPPGTPGGPPGPAGDEGPAGPVGPTGYDSTPIGATMTWTGRSAPSAEYVQTNGQELSKFDYPDGYTFAQTEEALGNPDWTTTSTTFTVPNYVGRFMFNRDVMLQGFKGGAKTVTLTAAQSGVNGSGTTTSSGAHEHPVTAPDSHSWGVIWADPVEQVGITFAFSPDRVNSTGWSRALKAVSSGSAHAHPLSPRTADQSHENMPPYVAVTTYVKVAGVSIDSGTIVGPSGADGQDGAPGGMAGFHQVEPYGGAIVADTGAAGTFIVMASVVLENWGNYGDSVYVEIYSSATGTLLAETYSVSNLFQTDRVVLPIPNVVATLPAHGSVEIGVTPSATTVYETRLTLASWVGL